MEKSPEFIEALENFRKLAEQAIRAHFDRSGFTFATPNVEISVRGKRYAKLVRTESDPQTGTFRGQTFVHSFVEIATGDIFKPASFKAPAKHARGNIYSDNPESCLTYAGDVHYLR